MLSFDENSWKTQFSYSVLQLYICVVGKIPAYILVMLFFFTHFNHRIILYQIIPSSLSNVPYICVMQSTMETKSQCVLFGTDVLQSPVVCLVLFLIGFSGCTCLTRKTIFFLLNGRGKKKHCNSFMGSSVLFHTCVADSSILHRSEHYSR